MNKRRQPALILAFVAAGLALPACGGKSAAASDAGGGPDAGTDAVDGAMTCDPGTQNCPATQKCDFTCQGGDTAAVACGPDGTGAIGAACSFSMPCARGNGCITMPTGGSICRKYCSGDGDCATGERCHNDTVFVKCTGPETSFLLHFCYE
jgi:hypothetical protein